jgi:energy-coupling factor transporter ATP-binding protein EcfA2
MQLTAFRLFKYRNIQDSGLVKLADHLTCIVGKNQSGKTNLLKGLQKFNPHEKSVQYDVRSDWPRGERRSKNENQVVCEAHFYLDEEQEELAALTHPVSPPTRAVVTKNYAGQYSATFPDYVFPDVLNSNEVERICATLKIPEMPLGELFACALGECIEEVRRSAHQGHFTQLALQAELHREKLERAESADHQMKQNESQFVAEYVNLVGQISYEIAALPTIQRQAEKCVIRHLPTFIYMDDYRTLEGNAHLDQVLQRIDQPLPQDETLLMIFNLAGLDLKKLVELGHSSDPSTIRERQYDLQDAGEMLTNAIANRWAQSPFRVQFRADGQRFFTEIEELDKNMGMLPLEEQSRGFKWFFSFDLRFMHDSGGTFAKCVLLLDEPGMHLHPGSQDDLLRRFDAYALQNILIYTTHLPFLVDLREPSRIHVIKEREDRSASVSNDLAASGPDEKLTLQAALGMKAAQRELVAHKNLVVAGADELFILTAFSSLLERSGRPGLADDVAIVAAGSAGGILYRAIFMVGQGLEVVALFNSDQEGREQEARLRKKWLTRYKNTHSSTVLLGDALGEPGDLGIEDLFSEKTYLRKAQEVHAAALTSAGVKSVTPVGSGTLAVRVARGFAKAGVSFDHEAVSKVIRKELQELRRMPYLSDIGRETADKAERLFAFLNDRFST